MRNFLKGKNNNQYRILSPTINVHMHKTRMALQFSEKRKLSFTIRTLYELILILFFSGMVGCSDSKVVSDFKAKEETSKPASGEEVKPSAQSIINDTVVDVFRSPDTGSERVTQALLCQPVKILEENSEWSKVQVADGYTGWIKSDKIDKTFNSISSSKVVIKSKLKNIYSRINGTSSIKQATMGTELYFINKTDDWYEVALPMNTTGWMEDKDTLKVQTGDHVPETTGAEFVETAKKFLGVPYLWGGMGAAGIDCSGLTYICGRVNGVDLSRDAQPQYDAIPASVEPAAEKMKTGDLIYFSAKVNSKTITHVGIYIGDNKFLHASGSAGKVTITSLSDDYYKERIVGVKRIFKN